MRRPIYPLVALLAAACAGNPGAQPTSGASAAATAAPATITASPIAHATTRPSATPAPNSVYTADDEAIATLIKAGAEEAIPQLKRLNEMDPGKLEDLFLPLDVWITSQRAGLESHAPSSCTTAAVALFADGMDRYDDIRSKFLAWRDWGAHGHAFPPAAPGQAVLRLEAALVELEAHCAV